MKTLLFNRYVEALMKTILFFAISHLVILAGIALRENLHVLNAFNILSLDYFMPQLREGVANFILSYCMVLIVYCPVYLLFTKPKRKNEP